MSDVDKYIKKQYDYFMSKLSSGAKQQFRKCLEELLRFYGMALSEGLFTDKYGRALKNPLDTVGFSYPFGGRYFVVKVRPYELYKRGVEAWLRKNADVKVEFPQVDPRPLQLQALDTRDPTIRGRKLSGVGKKQKVLPGNRFTRPYEPSELPKELRDKMTDGNREWAEKQLDRDAEKPDDERRWI